MFVGEGGVALVEGVIRARLNSGGIRAGVP